MFRSRRYRSFVIFSVIFGLALLQFLRSHEWSDDVTGAKPNVKVPPASTDHDPSLSHGSSPEFKFDSKPTVDAPSVPQGKSLKNKESSDREATKQKELFDDVNENSAKIQKTPTYSTIDNNEEIGSLSVESPILKASSDKSQPKDAKKPVTPTKDQQGRIDDSEHVQSSISRQHWKKLPEHFPVPESEIISLPSGQPGTLPRLQHVIKVETPAEKSLRIQRLAAIKEEFEHSWSGYADYAIGHDEVKPVTGGYRDPFAGWGATLVDALDTLWIMDLRDEFANAVEEVSKIDFTTAIRKDIPVFETVIRYLGGLIGAYDISGQKYRILLDKAVELAEILMGAFDTPNRMPVTYYLWAPDSVAQPRRAGTRVVLAELGSLSMEFTRLAQLTQEHKYYDAIARITDELEIMQNNTRLPGMWPLAIDASGCSKESTQLRSLDKSESKFNEDRGMEVASPLPTPKSSHKNSPLSRNMDKRESGLEADAQPADYEAKVTTTTKTPTTTSALNSDSFPKKECEKQGLTSPPYSKSDRFGLGGQSDSTYEYLPKEYMLLGGLSDQYRSLYEVSMKPVREKLLFRPMLPEKEDIRFLATAQVLDSIHESNGRENIQYTYEGTHLTCFAGGMFAVGAKLFGIDGDMDIAARLTDGCVWAYESTKTGIMPEGFELLPCDDPLSCSWNETKYLDIMDPHETSRIKQAESSYERQLRTAKQTYETSHQKSTNIVNPVRNAETHGTEATHKETHGGIVKRDTSLHGSDDYDEHAHLTTSRTSVAAEEVPKSRFDTEVPGFELPPKPPVLSHKEYVERRLEEERIPLGYTKIQSRKYILRPEAIESVFIMYRLTGDQAWREKGWKMFEAISRHCRTELAESAISDVTSTAPELLDEMESFWLAETLKYFYLLFSDPSVVSLDEYVLNTEAHPFKRPVE